MQVYLALYGVVGGEHKFLIAKKNCCSRFYNHKRLQNQLKITNGPGSWVFPGGKAENLQHLQEAYREFKEETGVCEREICTFGKVDCITDNKFFKIFFVYCTNIEKVAELVYLNLGNIAKVKDDELFTAVLSTLDEATMLFLESGEDSSWFNIAIEKFYTILSYSLYDESWITKMDSVYPEVIYHYL